MSIKVEHLEFTYFEDRKNILCDLSAEFDAGEITILTGASLTAPGFCAPAASA